MKIAIAGSRGSIPSPSRKGLGGNAFETSEFGGDTTSFYVEVGKRKMIFDAGSGIRDLGMHLMSNGFAPNGLGQAYVFITHTHWDHIQGLPFFTPAYIGSNDIQIYGPVSAKKDLKLSLSKHPFPAFREGEVPKEIWKDLDYQQNGRNFPVPLTVMTALHGFYDIAGGEGLWFGEEKVRLETMNVNHPGGCLSYKLSEGGKSVVFMSDFEPHFDEKKDEYVAKWWDKASLVIADGQYERGSDRNKFMTGWGHSDPIWNVDTAERAGVERLVITHHDPKSDDKYLKDFERRVSDYAKDKGYKVQVSFARQGDWYEL